MTSRLWRVILKVDREKYISGTVNKAEATEQIMRKGYEIWPDKNWIIIKHESLPRIDIEWKQAIVPFTEPIPIPERPKRNLEMDFKSYILRY